MGRLTEKERALEKRIAFAAERMWQAQDLEAAQIWWNHFVRLTKRRTPSTVHWLENERGLN